MERYNELIALVEASKVDFEKFYDKKNKTAGTRVRKAMQELTNAAKDVRKEVSEIKNQA